MIAADQPTIFGDKVLAVLSSTEDGNLKFGIGDDARALENRKGFLDKIGVDINHTSLVGITYDTDDFTKYRIATVDDKAVGMLKQDMTRYVDALVVREPGHALFLPLADCAGVILHDPETQVLMLSHLGRHSVEQGGAATSVEYLKETCDVDPGNLLVWISPSVGKASYPLNMFDGQSLQEVIMKQLQETGVARDHIQASDIDTAHNENYYSHSQYLKGNETNAGRFAVVAMMLEQGEPAV
jgi:copper oxidase (laccase) domain-containing protein